MAVYPLQELKNLITQMLMDIRHCRTVDGEQMQERLHDILDSLAAYTDAKVVEPAVNYYVNDILWDPLIGALTLVRAGGILPVNISIDLDGRYQLLSDSDKVGEEIVDAGEQEILFDTPYPEEITGDDYIVPMIWGKGQESGTWIQLEAIKKTRFGFSVISDEPVTVPYFTKHKS